MSKYRPCRFDSTGLLFARRVALPGLSREGEQNGGWSPGNPRLARTSKQFQRPSRHPELANEIRALEQALTGPTPLISAPKRIVEMAIH
jgi:hypothetical protein